MKSRLRLTLLALPSMASFLPGCGCGHNRQIVYPERAIAPIQADSREHSRFRRARIESPAPARKVDADPRRIDVPMIQPE